MGKGEKIKTSGYWYYKDITLTQEAKNDYERVYGTDTCFKSSHSIEEYDQLMNDKES